ncbi:MAG: hypothetical protein ACI91B_004808 [Planctomycetota bacterium]|jgi:hypothetical protein
MTLYRELAACLIQHILQAVRGGSVGMQDLRQAQKQRDGALLRCTATSGIERLRLISSQLNRHLTIFRASHFRFIPSASHLAVIPPTKSSHLRDPASWPPRPVPQLGLIKEITKSTHNPLNKLITRTANPDR